jgi:hypothetical protein
MSARSDLSNFILKYHHIARGALLVALGLLIALTAYYVEQHVILFASIGFGVFAVYEGIIHIVSSPIKADIALDLAKAKAWTESKIGYDPTGVTSPPNNAALASAALATPAVIPAGPVLVSSPPVA